MNKKTFIINVLGVFLVFEICNFVIHSLLLSKTYMQFASLWRPDVMNRMWMMNIADLIFSIFFVYVFSKGYENKGILEGLRYGLIMCFLIVVPGIINQFVVYPIPRILAVKWLFFNSLQILACALAAAVLTKRLTATKKSKAKAKK